MSSAKKRSRRDVEAETKIHVPWCVSPQNLFLIHSPLEELDVGVKGELLAEVTPGGELKGNFRWALSGKSNVTMTFSLQQVMDVKHADEFELVWEERPGDIPIPPNRNSSGWEDLLGLVVQGRITAVKNGADGADDLIGKEISLFAY